MLDKPSGIMMSDRYLWEGWTLIPSFLFPENKGEACEFSRHRIHSQLQLPYVPVGQKYFHRYGEFVSKVNVNIKESSLIKAE